MDRLTGTYRGPRGDVFELRPAGGRVLILFRSLKGNGFVTRVIEPGYALSIAEHAQRITDLRNRTVPLWP